ncbi:MAG: restriction endonuclease subunit S [Rickettsiales bacterium]|nr:restriction endonuclease subunit S [Rickettsiales bacterium]
MPNNQIDVNYLRIVVSKLNFIDSGSIILQLTVPKVKNLKIPVPPIAEQKKLFC